MKKCYQCHKVGRVADDETGPGQHEMAVDSRGLVAMYEYVCGECLEEAEDAGGEECQLGDDMGRAPSP